MSRALYRKYRSRSLDEIVGQSHITNVLKRSIEQGRISHAYLLTGPRGVGKTSIARIIAHEINKLPYADDDGSHIDIIEIDAASNNGVDDIRELRDRVAIAPVIATRKVYIIDEVHMLSKSAFNALLKTLEEPPEHVVFILATTDIDKLPATIVSRTQRFSFRAIPDEDIVKHLRSIAEKEQITIDNAALELIAHHGDGSFRDSITLLDQLTSLSDTSTGVTAELVELTLGLAPLALIQQLLAATIHNDLEQIVALLDTARNSGIAGSTVAHQLMRNIRPKIAFDPKLIPLLDSLLEVGRSPHPEYKLLCALGSFHTEKPHPKNAALQATVHEISVPIKSLERKASQSRPKDPPRETAQPSTTAAPSSIDWDALIEYARTHTVATYSVLSKCTHEIRGSELILYTGNSFYKKKLDDAKYLSHVHDCLTAIGAEGLEIVTIPTPPPPKDSQAAAVAVIMGGGEEINLE